MKKSVHRADLINEGSLIFLALAIFNALSLLYQLYMVRNLSPIDYGVLNSLFSILAIVSIPTGALQTLVTKFVSAFYAVEHHARISLLLRHLVKRTSVFGLAVLLMFVLGSRWISSFLQIPSPLYVVMLGVITFLSTILPLSRGGLQGLQRFGYLGLTMIVNGSLKLLLGVIFVSVGFGVIGAMSALAVSTFVALVLSATLLVSALPRSSGLAPESSPLKSEDPDSEMNFSDVYRYFVAAATVLLCFMILTNLDVVLVKHFFSPSEAGYYCIAQMVGKLIIFLPIAVTLVMLPKTSELHAQGKATSHLLKKSLLYVAVLCGTGATVCLLFPGLAIRLLSGEEHPDCVPLARLFSVTMAFFALVYVFMIYNLAIHRLRFIYPLVLLAALQILAIVLFHRSLQQVLYIMCGNAVLLFLINAYMAFGWRQGPAASGVGKTP